MKVSRLDLARTCSHLIKNTTQQRSSFSSTDSDSFRLRELTYLGVFTCGGSYCSPYSRYSMVIISPGRVFFLNNSSASLSTFFCKSRMPGRPRLFPILKPLG